MNNYLYKGTIITASTKKEAIQKIIADSSDYISSESILKPFIKELDSKQRGYFRSRLIEFSRERSTVTSYSYIKDENGVQWMSENLAYDDDEEGIIYETTTKSFYYTFEAANRIAKKLGARLPNQNEWFKLALSLGAIVQNEEDSGFRKRSDKSIVLKKTSKLRGFLNIDNYPGLFSNLKHNINANKYSIYWTDTPIGGGAVSEYVAPNMMATVVMDKKAYLTVRLVK